MSRRDRTPSEISPPASSHRTHSGLPPPPQLPVLSSQLDSWQTPLLLMSAESILAISALLGFPNSMLIVFTIPMGLPGATKRCLGPMRLAPSPPTLSQRRWEEGNKGATPQKIWHLTVTTQLPHSYRTVTTQLPHSYHTVTTRKK